VGELRNGDGKDALLGQRALASVKKGKDAQKDDVRPLAICHPLIHAAAHLMNRLIKDKVKDVCGVEQFGCGARGGPEIVAHLARLSLLSN
jgi:hypothetical protein